MRPPPVDLPAMIAALVRVLTKYPDTCTDLAAPLEYFNTLRDEIENPLALSLHRRRLARQVADLEQPMVCYEPAERRSAIMGRLGIRTSYFYGLRKDARRLGYLTKGIPLNSVESVRT